jgi:beta-lactamase superfamily II metal-dependent hydrolase
VAPLANLLAVPLLAPLLALGAALAGAAIPVANASIWVAWVYYGLAIATIGAALWRTRRRAHARAADGLPPAPSYTGRTTFPRRARFRWLLVSLAGLVLLTTCGAAAPALASNTTRLDFLDVGPGGEATLLRLADGTTALIDGGPGGPSLDEALAARLPFWQRSLDLVLLTDPRPGDETGLQDAVDHFAIGRGADAGMVHPTSTYLAWLDALARAGTTHVRIRQDDLIQLDASTTLRVLGPPQTLYLASGGATTESNDLILRLDTPGLRALLLGSADGYALDALAFAGEPLAADVVEVALPPNAGLDLSGPLGAILVAAHPRLIVIAQAPPPAGPHARSASAPDTIWPPDAANAQILGATIVRTSSAGTVSLAQRPDGGWDLEGA